MSEVHAQARTTPRTRADIKASTESVAKLAERYDISRATARKRLRVFIDLDNKETYTLPLMPMKHHVKELLLEDGDSPFAEWFGSLEAVAAAKVRVAVSRMEQGNLSNVEWFRGIGEYKIDWGPGLRIYLAKEGLKIIILIGGGTKKRQQQDIDQAVGLWEDYKRRKASTRQGK
jgi:putative addiction module killer protein